jgi:DNA-binding NtrC family response regulator
LDRLAEQIQPALAAVLSDINMPGMDGLQLLSEIKQCRPDLPVLMVTVFGDDERRRHARGLGAFDFITKRGRFRSLEGAAYAVTQQRRRVPSARLEWPLCRRADRQTASGQGPEGGTLTRPRRLG